MCGIGGILGIPQEGRDSDELRSRALKIAKTVRHRGPDWSGACYHTGGILVHERLAVVDVDHGAQPLVSERGCVLAANGEIYNHRTLREQFEGKYSFKTNSDCEPILALYESCGSQFLTLLNGIFAFAIFDPRDDSFLIARDPIGVVPLYWGRSADGTLYVASEMKAIVEYVVDIAAFPPGHFFDSKTENLHSYFEPRWKEEPPAQAISPAHLRQAFEAAVHRQLMCDVPFGVLLSGGLDSSLVAAITSRFSKKRIESGDKEPAWWPQIHTFSVGLTDSPDLIKAREVATFLGTIHHEVNFTIQEGLDALSDVIFHLETFDVTTVRASTPMYLLSRRIRTMGIKMILSGEGADEVFGGYLYFHKAPNREEFHRETVRKVLALHQYDCLRANKSTAAWGLEVRVPFLDLEFLETVMNLDPQAKMVPPGGIEKHILRNAFEGVLPSGILWRQKEQFSDGVGYSWIDGLKAYAESTVSDVQWDQRHQRFPEKTPTTKESYVYRSLFEAHFPLKAVATVPYEPSVACSSAVALSWDASFQNLIDPSGRAVAGVHQAALEHEA